MLTYQLAHSITEIAPAEWDAVVGAELTMSHRWLRVVEQTWQHCQSLYVLFRNGEEAIAVAVANRETPFHRASKAGSLLTRCMFFVTPPFSSTGCGVLTRPGVELAQVLPQVVPILERIMWHERRPLLVISNLPGQDLPVWQTQAFAPSAQPCLSILDLPASYADYLQTLDKKDRAELRRIRRRAAEQQVTFQQGPLNGDGEAIYPLLRTVFDQHATPIPFTPAFFTRLEQVMPDEVMLFKGFVSGQLAGVSFCLRHAQTLWWPMVGLDYALARPTYLYFLLIDEMVQWSIQQGIQRIYGGTTAEQEKRKHGFYQQERWLGYHAQPAVLNHVIKFALPLAQRYLKAGNPTLNPPQGEGTVKG